MYYTEIFIRYLYTLLLIQKALINQQEIYISNLWSTARLTRLINNIN